MMTVSAHIPPDKARTGARSNGYHRPKYERRIIKCPSPVTGLIRTFIDLGLEFVN